MVSQTAVTAFHCATPALSQLDDQLQHFCHYGRALTLVIGPPGSGRSHLARRLKQLLSAHLPVALIEAHPLLSAGQLDQSALQQLGLTQYALQNTELSLAVSQAAPGRRVLIVDDAQDLGLHLLRSLMEAIAAEWEREDPRLCLVLIGDEMLETALAELSFSAIPGAEIQRLHMPAFSLDDAMRLATVWAASMAEPEPGRETVRLAWQKSFGRPGTLLNLLSSSGALMAESHEHDDAELDTVEHVSNGQYSVMEKYGWLKLPLIFLGVFALALILLYQREFNEWISGDEKTTQTSATGTRESLPIDAQPITTTEAEPAPLTIVEEGEASLESEPQTNIPAQQQQQTEGIAVIEPSVVTTVPSEPETRQPQISNETKPEPKPEAKPDPKPETRTEPLVKKTERTAVAADFSSDEQRLLAASNKYFAVQIIALSDPNGLQAFQRKHGLQQALHYQGERNGKPWYVLVLAPFADRAAAERARDNLPAEVRKQGPWIKSMAAIQQEIKAAGN